MSVWTAISDLFHDRADFHIIGRRRVFFIASAVALVVSFAGLGLRGLNLGIDFEGGTAWETEVRGRDPGAGGVREVLAPLGEGNAKVTVLGGDSVRVQSITTDDAGVTEVTRALARYAGVDPADVTVQTVGPTFGAEVTDKAVRALIVFMLAVSVYLAFRFEPKMAGAAVVALLHDLGLTVGVYALTGFEVTPGTVIAILTILGYSLYDTVVVFDKIRENTAALAATGRHTYSGIVNRSLNQTLMRSLNTSFSTLIPVSSLLVVGGYLLGAVAIRDFSLALFIGLIVGTYSSLFVAAPVLAAWKEREPRFRTIRQRLAQRTPAAVPAGRPTPDADADAGAAAPAETSLERAEREVRAARSTSPLAPRPRQQRRRKRRR